MTHRPPTCPRCGSVLSAVTWECVRGEHCREPRIPGTEPERLRVEERRKRSTRPQQSVDGTPLFGDAHKQGDLL